MEKEPDGGDLHNLHPILHLLGKRERKGMKSFPYSQTAAQSRHDILLTLKTVLVSVCPLRPVFSWTLSPETRLPWRVLVPWKARVRVGQWLTGWIYEVRINSPLRRGGRAAGDG